MSRFRRLPAVPLVAAVLLAGAAIAARLGLADGDDPHTVTLRLAAPAGTPAVRVGGPLPVRPIPPGFLGLSLEYTALPAYAGTDPRSLDPVFLALVRNLTPGQAPVLRIGGDTTDWSWVRVPGMRRPPGIRYTIGPDWLRVAGALVRALHPRLILGINLEAGSTRLAATEARALLAAVGRPSVQALEIGNEPELYGTWGWYTPPGGRPVPGRPASYDMRSYAADFARFAQVLPRVPLAGPAIAGSSWTGRMGQLLAAAPGIALVTVHRYPLRACDTPAASPAAPTIAHLLSPQASSGLAASVVPVVRVAAAHRLPVRVDELNSVSCRGERGVSNAFASALWMLNTLFAMARAGVQGVNVHTLPASIYFPFRFELAHGRWRGIVEPDYYGMLMFARAVPPGSRLLAIDGRAAGGVEVWAARAPDGRTMVVLIDTGSGPARYVPLEVPGARGPAALCRLRAATLSATGGVTICGQSFGSPTHTGVLAGRRQRIAVAPVGREYVVKLPPASAALLTFGGR